MGSPATPSVIESNKSETNLALRTHVEAGTRRANAELLLWRVLPGAVATTGWALRPLNNMCHITIITFIDTAIATSHRQYSHNPSNSQKSTIIT